MKQEVDKYPGTEREALLTALQAWRLPYWDWALKKPDPQNPKNFDYNVPLVVREKQVNIRLPTIQGYGPCPNAFYQFTMPDGIKMGDQSLEHEDKDILKDLRITKDVVKVEGETYTIPVSLHFLFSTWKLTSSSLISAKARVDMRRAKVSIKTGSMGSRTSMLL